MGVGEGGVDSFLRTSQGRLEAHGSWGSRHSLLRWALLLSLFFCLLVTFRKGDEDKAEELWMTWCVGGALQRRNASFISFKNLIALGN